MDLLTRIIIINLADTRGKLLFSRNPQRTRRFATLVSCLFDRCLWIVKLVNIHHKPLHSVKVSSINPLNLHVFFSTSEKIFWLVFIPPRPFLASSNDSEFGLPFFLFTISYQFVILLYIYRIYTAKSRPSTPKRQRCLSSAISSSMFLFFMKSS